MRFAKQFAKTDIQQKHPESAPQKTRIHPACQKSGKCRSDNPRRRTPYHRFPFHASISDMRNESSGCTTQKIQQINSAGGILFHRGKSRQINNEQRSAADPEPADNARNKPYRYGKCDLHNNSTALIPPYSNKIPNKRRKSVADMFLKKKPDTTPPAAPPIRYGQAN